MQEKVDNRGQHFHLLRASAQRSRVQPRQVEEPAQRLRLAHQESQRLETNDFGSLRGHGRPHRQGSVKTSNLILSMQAGLLGSASGTLTDLLYSGAESQLWTPK